jgi:hypothetical protein
MADVNSVTAIPTPPVSVSAPVPVNNNAQSSAQTAPTAPAAPASPATETATTYTALATVSTSNIRGVGTNQSA